jgi:hypothetical protein
MSRRSRRALTLDVLTWIVAIAAVAMFARDRMIPWLADRSMVDPGDRVGTELALIDAVSGDSIRATANSPTLLFVFRSTCAACERAVPSWTRLARLAGSGVIAVGLEPAAAVVRYVRSRFPFARPAVPADPTRFARQFRIQVVPTTLIIDREGRLAVRRAGPLEDSDVTGLRQLLAPSVP